jgi:hypothetical protein
MAIFPESLEVRLDDLNKTIRHVSNEFVCILGGKIASAGNQPAVPKHENDQSSIAEMIENHFLKRMKTSRIPLFQNFSSYAESLPVRLGNEYLRLYTLPYLVRKEDLTTMALKTIEEFRCFIYSSVCEKFV